MGATTFCPAPAKAIRQKARIGGTENPDVRRIVALRPVLVIVNTDENRLTTAQELESLGLRILVTRTDSLDEVEATWTQLGEATAFVFLLLENRYQRGLFIDPKIWLANKNGSAHRNARTRTVALCLDSGDTVPASP